MGLIHLFDKWIQEHGSAALSKEVIADLRQKIVDSDSAHAKEVQELNVAQAKEIARLNEIHAEEMANLERTMQLKAETREGEVVEHLGAIFKRKADGTFHEAVYCPKCGVSTASIFHMPYACDSCRWNASFGDEDLPRILKELPA
jgi:predicted Zn-ribbon and HTH transcriptional regulator